MPCCPIQFRLLSNPMQNGTTTTATAAISGMGLDGPWHGPLFFCGGLDPLLSVVQCGPTLFSSVKVPHLSSAAFPLNHAVRESAPPCPVILLRWHDDAGCCSWSCVTAPLVAFCTKLIPSFATCTTEISPNLPGRGYHPVAVLAVVVHCILFGVSERVSLTHTRARGPKTMTPLPPKEQRGTDRGGGGG